MAYRYFVAGSSLLTNPKESYIYDFQSKLDGLFDVASDVFQIREETYFSSGSFQNVKVRINDAINNLTGIKLGDDFKTILFQDVSHSVDVGLKYYFDGNYWITVNTSQIKNLVASCTVRRCNNVLRWTDENGRLFSEHCVIDYKIGTPDNKARTDPIIPEGTIQVFCQLNDKTRTIKENQRFLFGNSGNWVCYRIYGGGINNFLNQETTDNDTTNILSLATGKHFVNEETDDIVNGIADRYKNVYTITISPSAISGGVGDSYLLTSVVNLNSTPVDKAVAYNSDNLTVATISGSVVSMLANGSAIITGCMVDNTDVTDTTNVIVSASVVENNVRFSPALSYILQGETQSFDCYYYENGVQQSGSFLFTVANSNVPVDNYELLTTGSNSFSIENIKLYLDNPLVVNAISGSISGQLSLVLRGAW